jgi:hypothetical protein
MNEFAIKPPEGKEWPPELISNLVNLIQAIKFASSDHHFYTKQVLLDFAVNFDSDFIKLLLSLHLDRKLSGLVHIYNKESADEPFASILPTSPSLTVFRNV